MEKVYNTLSFLTLGSPHEQNKKGLCVRVPKNANLKSQFISETKYCKYQKREYLRQSRICKHMRLVHKFELQFYF